MKSGSTDLSPENRTYPRFAHDHAEAYAPARRIGDGRCRIFASDRDFLDHPAGKPEDAVLRHRQTQRGGARQTRIKAAQYPGHDAMADRDDRTVADIAEPGGDARGKPVIALAVGGAEIPLVAPLEKPSFVVQPAR